MKLFNGLASGKLNINGQIFDVQMCHGLVIIRGDGFIYRRIDIQTHFLQTGKIKSRRLIKDCIKKIITNPMQFGGLSVVE